MRGFWQWWRQAKTQPSTPQVHDSPAFVDGDEVAASDPRFSDALLGQLRLLWSDNIAHAERQIHLPIDTALFSELGHRVRARSPLPPTSPAALYALTVEAVRGYIGQQCVGTEAEDAHPSGVFNHALLQTIQMAEIVHMWEVHDLYCDLLVSVGLQIVRLRHTQRGTAEYYNTLLDALNHYFLMMPPDRIPRFWDALRDPKTSSDYWPIVGRMTNRAAAPFLLEVLPVLADDGKAQAIKTLTRLEDARAVPALQTIAHDPNSLLAPIAENAIRQILKHSRDDAALLMRPSDARLAPHRGADLLRAAASPGNTPADELLRAAGEDPARQPIGSKAELSRAQQTQNDSAFAPPIQTGEGTIS